MPFVQVFIMFFRSVCTLVDLFQNVSDIGNTGLAGIGPSLNIIGCVLGDGVELFLFHPDLYQGLRNSNILTQGSDGFNGLLSLFSLAG